MRNILFLLGGGALVYWYMCNSKKHNCNCKGDFENLKDKVEKAGEETEKYLNEAVLEKDGSYVNRPTINKTGEKEEVIESFDELRVAPVGDRGSYLTAFNLNRPVINNVSSLYKRYNTSKEATVSPNRVRLIVID